VGIAGILGSVLLSAAGALLWLGGGLLSGLWDVGLAVASACNAYPLLYAALYAFFGPRQ
jgi:hypothetical protein